MGSQITISIKNYVRRHARRLVAAIFLLISLHLLYVGLCGEYINNLPITTMVFAFLIGVVVISANAFFKGDIQQIGACLLLLCGVPAILILICARDEVQMFTFVIIGFLIALTCIYIYFYQTVSNIFHDVYAKILLGVVIICVSIGTKVLADLFIIEATRMPAELFPNAQIGISALMTVLIVILILLGLLFSLLFVVVLHFLLAFDWLLLTRPYDSAHKKWSSEKSLLNQAMIRAAIWWRWYKNYYGLFGILVALAFCIYTYFLTESLERLGNKFIVYSSFVKNNFQEKLNIPLYCVNLKPDVFVMVSNESETVIAEWPDDAIYPVFYKSECISLPKARRVIK